MTRKVGVILCSHLQSQRLPRKAFREIAGQPVIVNLLRRLEKTELGVYLAVPDEEYDEYEYHLNTEWPDRNYGFHGIHHAYPSGVFGTWLEPGHAGSPLHRMADVAKRNNLDVIIRVCHDKILVDPDIILDALSQYTNQNQYLYSSHLADGCGFEIFSRKLLDQAAEKFAGQNVEHVSYAIRYFKPEMIDYKPAPYAQSDARLLLDYPEDETLMKVVLRGDPDRPMADVLQMLDRKPVLKDINRLPLITFYSCVYNGADTINRTIESVAEASSNIESSEYIIVDDASTDDTLERILEDEEFTGRLVVNEKNIGLASSSNIALKMARGRYIMRIDADDRIFAMGAYWLFKGILDRKCDALYSTYRDGNYDDVGNPRTHHHVGCALFDTRAMRHFQFTEKLRGYEGLDFFERAKDTLNISYWDNSPTWFYTHSQDSMSRTDSPQRAAIKAKLDAGITGGGLVDG